MRLASSLALLASARADFNDMASSISSLPGTIDSNTIRFTDITHRAAVIHWDAPDLGNWQWPILGYEIRITDAVSWDRQLGSESSAAVPGYEPDNSFAASSAWDTCPAGEDGDELAQCSNGKLTAVYWQPGDETSQTVVGLAMDTTYYISIRARNHDGPAAWSAPSYGLLTHDTPGAVDKPVVLSVSSTSATILFDTPVTTGSNDCTANDIAQKAADVAAYLADESCTVDGGSAESLDEHACSRTKSDSPCQTVGTGSAVQSYRITIAQEHCTPDANGDSVCSYGTFTELKDPVTGLSLYSPLMCAVGYAGEFCEPVSAENPATTSFVLHASGSTQYTIENLEPDTKYQIKILATNAAGQNDGKVSAAVEAQTIGKPLQPLPPVAVSVTETSIYLTWNTEVGYCGGTDTVPFPEPHYTYLTQDYPNEKKRTNECPVDSGSPLTGFRLFGSSFNPAGADVSGSWEPARRGSLTTDGTDTAYASVQDPSSLPAGLDDGTWLEFNVGNHSIDEPYVVKHLAQDTYYKFRIVFTNEVGDSVVSADSSFVLTLEAPISQLKMHAEPACIYEDAEKPTRFVATSNGTNVFYKWQLPDGVVYNAHNTLSFGSVIAEPGHSDKCLTTDCSVMEFVLPSISTAINDMGADGSGTAEMEGDGLNDFTVSVIAYNTRGQTMLQTVYTINYCGCTDPWDPNYWDQATYHLPLMCEAEQFDGADKTVIAGEFEYYQTYYQENTHSAQVIVRVDEGSVNLYTSTAGVPDPAMDTSYDGVWLGIQNFYVLEIPYSQLVGSDKLYIAIQGAEGAPFSRYAVVTTTREFSRGRGERYNGIVVEGSQSSRRAQLLNIEPQSFEIKTPYYDFFEYYFGRASNDMDVEIKVNCQLGCVNVYTSKIERYPSQLRSTNTYDGFWTNHKGTVCAGDQQPGTASAFATASFDGQESVYGMVTFSQMNGSDVSVGISMKGLINAAGTAGDITWAVHEFAVGSDTVDDATPCASAGNVYKSLPGTLPQTVGNAVYTETAVSGDITMYGDSIGSASESGESIVGRSVVINIPGKDPVCATIYPDSQVTSYFGELSLMHTLKPEDSVETCLSARDQNGVATGACDGEASMERLLFASVQGASEYAVGDEQLNNEYTIEAKVYRYRVESNLLEPQKSGTDCEVLAEGSVAGGSASVACGHASEDQRYSIVSLDNFNYYEVDVSPAAFGLTIYFTLHYGQVELYTSEHKLPTQDPAGYDTKFGDVYQPMAQEFSCGTYSGVDTTFTGACVREYHDEDGTLVLEQNALHQGAQFQPGSTYRITIPYDAVNVADKYIFLGVLGKSSDSSYEISVTEYLFEDNCAVDEETGDVLLVGDGGCHLPDSPEEPVEVELAAGEYSFFTMYVGPPDEAMEVTQRMMAGRRTGNLGTDVDAWGIDWTETLTSTWVEQQQDEWDLDVKIEVDVTQATGKVVLYGSTREPFPSEERGHDKRLALNCGPTDEDPDCGTGPFIIPHFTFSDKTVYISMMSEGGETVAFLPQITEYNLNKITGITEQETVDCEGAVTIDGVAQVCSGHGSCVVTDTATCYCDSGYLGTGCEIEAFCTGSGCENQPSLDISGSYANEFPGDAPVEVTFALASVPVNSKVHVYVDGMPYPAKGANVLMYSEQGCPPEFSCGVDAGKIAAEGSIKVFGMTASVTHVVELLLLNNDNIPLATDMEEFRVQYAGGCSNGCGDHGVCHHGYCVCFDGWAGISCSISESAEDYQDLLKAESFTPGGGFVTYNRALMDQERQEDAYISQLKLAANAESLRESDDSIHEKHNAVVAKLNSFVAENEQKMEELAEHQRVAADQLHRKRDRITTTIQQMREESKRLKTHNTEMYLETVRSLHEGQRQMQNDLDAKRRDHFIAMAKRHDEWVEIKEKNDFKLNQLRTANGPLVHIDDLQTRVCTQDDMFHTECVDENSTENFNEAPGYVSSQTVEHIGVCAPNSAAFSWSTTASGTLMGYSSDGYGGSCVCNPAPAGTGITAGQYSAEACELNGDFMDVDGTCYEASCVLVEIAGEMQQDLYHNIPR